MTQLGDNMHPFMKRTKYLFLRNLRQGKRLERPMDNFSRVLWPYPESKLIFYIGILAFLDFTSTLVALTISGNGKIYESGYLAKWALQTAGFGGLFIVDSVSIGAIVGLALIAKAFYKKLGLHGFARTAFILMLVPYFVIIWGVIVNNILMVFLHMN